MIEKIATIALTVIEKIATEKSQDQNLDLKTGTAETQQNVRVETMLNLTKWRPKM